MPWISVIAIVGLCMWATTLTLVPAALVLAGTAVATGCVLWLMHSHEKQREAAIARQPKVVERHVPPPAVHPVLAAIRTYVEPSPLMPYVVANTEPLTRMQQAAAITEQRERMTSGRKVKARPGKLTGMVRPLPKLARRRTKAKYVAPAAHADFASTPK